MDQRDGPVDDNEEHVLTIGQYSFRPAARRLIALDGREIELTRKEALLLSYLHKQGGKPTRRDILLREIWGYGTGIRTHTLETHVYRLRRKIEHDPANAELLLAEAGGYRLGP